MKLNAGKALVIAVTTALAVGCGQQATIESQAGNLEAMAASSNALGRYVVVFRSTTLPADATSRVQKAGGKVTKSIAQAGVVTFVSTAASASKLGADASVLGVSPERWHKLPEAKVEAADGLSTSEGIEAPTAADNLYGYQWDMRRIGAPAVWARVPSEVQATATVAVLDSGVMDTHPDLVGKIDYVKGTNYCFETGGTNNSPAYPTYTKWINFDETIPEPDPCTKAPNTLVNSHGTHVAGTVGAKVGGGRVVGTGPGLRLAAYKVFDRITYTEVVDGKEEKVDDVGAFDGPVFEAIIDAALNGFEVINMSLGSSPYRNNKEDNASIVAWDRVVKFADRMGVTIVGSAGNAAQDANGAVTHIPGDLPSIINVSATGSSNLVLASGQFNAAPGSDVIAFYSNYGAAVDISAPGGDCGPTYPKACVAQYLILNAGITETGATIGSPTYYFMAGTSMATPHVAAVAGLVRALHPDWTTGAVRSHLKETADDFGSRQLFGHGILNADAAVR